MYCHSLRVYATVSVRSSAVSAVSAFRTSPVVASVSASPTAASSSATDASAPATAATADVREHVRPVVDVCQQWSVQRRWAGGGGLQQSVSVRHGLRRLRWPGLLAAAQSIATTAIATTAIAVVAAARVERGPL